MLEQHRKMIVQRIISTPFIYYFVQPLTFLINKSIAHGTVPDELKIATLLPIY